MARTIAKSAAEVDSALDAEVWASHLLGTFREQRHGPPLPDAVGVDAALLFGEPLVTRLASFADPAARVALASIAELDDGELGVLAAELLAGSTPVAGVPRWIEQIGESEVVRAAVMSEAVFDDARTVLLESRQSPPSSPARSATGCAMSSSPRRRGAGSRPTARRPGWRRWRSTSASATPAATRCAGARWSSSCSWPTGFRARSWRRPSCSTACLSRSMPGCASPLAGAGSRGGPSTKPESRS